METVNQRKDQSKSGVRVMAVPPPLGEVSWRPVPSPGAAGGGLEIIPYRAEHAFHFGRLNKAWIEKYFVLEDLDRWVLDNPHEAILAKGGAILMAKYEGVIAGTVALIRVSDEEYELAKMAVDEGYQRKGIAEALSHAALEKAKERGAKKVSLYSQTSLAPAIQLYRKLGFAEVPMTGALYKRANIKMEIESKNVPARQ